MVALAPRLVLGRPILSGPLSTSLGRFPDRTRRGPHGKFARGYVLVDHGPGPRIGVLPDRDGRNQVRVHARKSAVSHHSTGFGLAVVVRRYGPRPEVGTGPDLRVAHVREVGNLAPGPDARVLDLAVGTDLGPCFEDRRRPQERVGTHARPVADLCPASDRMLDEGAIAHQRILEVGAWSDHAVGTDPR